jgi:hypothetical protein
LDWKTFEKAFFSFEVEYAGIEVSVTSLKQIQANFLFETDADVSITEG